MAAALATACAALTLSPCLAAEAQVGPGATPNASADGQKLGQLAYVLGVAHALHRVCSGPQDGFWYELMQRLIQTERPDVATRRQLIDQFNQGYAQSQTQYRDCNEASRNAAIDAARQGQALISSLAPPNPAQQH